MPPFVSRKRRLSSPHEQTPPPKKGPKRSSLFEAADTPTSTSSLQANQKFLRELDGSDGGSSSLSDANSSEFEDVMPTRTKKVPQEDSEDEDMDWEDALNPGISNPITPLPELTGDLELTLSKKDQISFEEAGEKKKGPSKIERQIRLATHCMHVQFLMFHNTIRNGWICDKDVQELLVSQLPPQMKELVKKWRRDSGFEEVVDAPSAKRKGKQKVRGKESGPRRQRDWGPSAERQEVGQPNLTHGDPLITLLKPLASYWRKRFKVTAPGLRKCGYRSIRALEEEISSFRTDKNNPDVHGERIDNLDEFRRCAKTGEGSRDVGAQLFTALLRGLEVEARLVASLQPIGFGWNKTEEAIQRKSPEKETAVDEESSVESDAKSDSSDNDSVIDITPKIDKRVIKKRFDRDLVFPNYWTEVFSPVSNRFYPVDSMVLNPAVYSKQEEYAAFEPRGAKADKAKQIFAYVIAHSSDGTAKDVTTRYLKQQTWPGKTKGVRMQVEKVPIYNKHGKVKRYEQYDWFKTVMSSYVRPHHRRTHADDIEDSSDLKPAKRETKKVKEGEETLQSYKQSAEFVLERHLRREEAIPVTANPVKTFSSGKGDKARTEPVFLRKHVVICKTPEQWRREGRCVKGREDPIKHVAIRAVTLNRKLEVLEEERETGVKVQQPMYSKAQTEYIIPPPISNGEIPKNEYGNIDIFVPSMVPRGAVHIPLRGTVRVCKKLGIDFAEAVTGFEFGNKRAVPVCDGVVVAIENEDAVIDLWQTEEEQKKARADGKREKAALAMWRKFLMGLRIVERVRDEYGEDLGGFDREEVNPFTNQNKRSDSKPVLMIADEDEEHEEHETCGGFIIEGDNTVTAGGFFRDEDKPQQRGTSTPVTEEQVYDDKEKETVQPVLLPEPIPDRAKRRRSGRLKIKP